MANDKLSEQSNEVTAMKENYVGYFIRRVLSIIILVVALITLVVSLLISIAVPIFMENMDTTNVGDGAYAWVGVLIVMYSMAMAYNVYLSGYCIFGLCLSLANIFISPTKATRIISIILTVIFAVGTVFAVRLRIQSGIAW